MPTTRLVTIPKLSPPPHRPQPSNLPILKPLFNLCNSSTPHIPQVPTATTQEQTANTSKRGNQSKNITKLNILQCNINGISNKIEELKDLAINNKIAIITIQETKLTNNSKTPNIPGYTTIRQDRGLNKGGGLITFVRHDLVFTELQPPQSIAKSKIEILTIKILLSPKKPLHITNIYIPPRDSNSQYSSDDQDITNCFSYLLSLNNLIITGDINAHSEVWHSPITDHRGSVIQDLIQTSDQIFLNQDTPTRIPPNTSQQPTSPDITTISSNLATFTTWQTTTALSSDHLSIFITINTKVSTLPKTNRCYTNYRKANWPEFTTAIDNTLLDSPTPNNVHIGNTILTNAILMADKYHIPKGKINTHHTPLPENITNKIKLRNSIRATNPKDPAIESLNKEINKLISIHKTNQWKEKLNGKWDHKSNTYTYWKTLEHLAGKPSTPQPNRTIQFNNKDKSKTQNIAQSFNKQFVNSTQHKTNKINRVIDRKTKKLSTDEDRFQSPSNR